MCYLGIYTLIRKESTFYGFKSSLLLSPSLCQTHRSSKAAASNKLLQGRQSEPRNLCYVAPEYYRYSETTIPQSLSHLRESLTRLG